MMRRTCLVARDAWKLVENRGIAESSSRLKVCRLRVLHRSSWGACGSWRVKSGIKGKLLLRLARVSANRPRLDEDQVPAFSRHRAWNNDELVRSQQGIAECLLSCARYSWREPIGVWDIRRENRMSLRRLGYAHFRYYVRHRIERLECLMYRHFQYRGSRIDGAVHCADTRAVPSTTAPERPLAAVPSGSVWRLIQTPGNEFLPAKYPRKRRHT